MDGDVRFKSFFAESLMQSKNTISGLTCLGKFLGTISQDFVKQHSFLQPSFKTITMRILNKIPGNANWVGIINYAKAVLINSESF
jgi:hypothetical protein